MSYVLLERDINGNLTTKLYDRRDSFSFSKVKLPYLCSIITSLPAYIVYISLGLFDLQGHALHMNSFKAKDRHIVLSETVLFYRKQLYCPPEIFTCESPSCAIMLHIIDVRFKIKLIKLIQFLENQNIRTASAIQRTLFKLFILMKKISFCESTVFYSVVFA